MSKKISILDLLFGGCETPLEVANRIRFLRPEYQTLTDNFNLRSADEFANRVYGSVKSNMNNHVKAGALLAGACENYSPDKSDLFYLRALCIRLGHINGLLPAHDMKYCS